MSFQFVQLVVILGWMALFGVFCALIQRRSYKLAFVCVLLAMLLFTVNPIRMKVEEVHYADETISSTDESLPPRITVEKDDFESSQARRLAELKEQSLESKNESE